MSQKSSTQQQDITTLQTFEGKGHLRCQHFTTWVCEFAIIRLINGRLRVRAVPDVSHSSSSSWNRWLRKCEPFSVEGADKDGVQLSAQDIHFTRTVLNIASSQDVLVGYAQSATRRSREELSGPATIKCELSNFRASSPAYPVNIEVESSHVEIGRLGWMQWGEIDEHSNAFRHATISAYLRIRDVSPGEEEKATERLQKIASLLSIAGRGHVFLAARHRFDVTKRSFDSEFSEPVFTARAWLRPLIPAESLAEFLLTACPNLTARYRSFELGNVVDHYLQALTLSSAWPLSLGIFTAMEALKAAYFRQAENEADGFWVPPQEFEADKRILDELVTVLSNHFPRFSKLSSAEKQSLKKQLSGIGRRSYKYQLQTMFDRLGISYSRKELQAFIDIRNSIIHEGVPIRGDVAAEEYQQGTSTAWQRIMAAASLFERALLGVLGYTGPRELFDAAEEADLDK